MKFLLFTIFYLLTLILPVRAYYDLTIPVDGNTIADDKLQFLVIKDLYKIYAKEYPSCSDYSIKNTQIIHYPYDVKKRKNKYISGYWKEMWTVSVCDRPNQIPITFYINSRGASFYIDKSFLKF